MNQRSDVGLGDAFFFTDAISGTRFDLTEADGIGYAPPAHSDALGPTGLPVYDHLEIPFALGDGFSFHFQSDGISSPSSVDPPYPAPNGPHIDAIRTTCLDRPTSPIPTVDFNRGYDGIFLYDHDGTYVQFDLPAFQRVIVTVDGMTSLEPLAGINADGDFPMAIIATDDGVLPSLLAPHSIDSRFYRKNQRRLFSAESADRDTSVTPDPGLPDGMGATVEIPEAGHDRHIVLNIQSLGAEGRYRLFIIAPSHAPTVSWVPGVFGIPYKVPEPRIRRREEARRGDNDTSADNQHVDFRGELWVVFQELAATKPSIGYEVSCNWIEDDDLAPVIQSVINQITSMIGAIVAATDGQYLPITKVHMIAQDVTGIGGAQKILLKNDRTFIPGRDNPCDNVWNAWSGTPWSLIEVSRSVWDIRDNNCKGSGIGPGPDIRRLLPGSFVPINDIRHGETYAHEFGHMDMQFDDEYDYSDDSPLRCGATIMGTESYAWPVSDRAHLTDYCTRRNHGIDRQADPPGSVPDFPSNWELLGDSNRGATRWHGFSEIEDTPDPSPLMDFRVWLQRNLIDIIFHETLLTNCNDSAKARLIWSDNPYLTTHSD